LTFYKSATVPFGGSFMEEQKSVYGEDFTPRIFHLHEPNTHCPIDNPKAVKVLVAFASRSAVMDFAVVRYASREAFFAIFAIFAVIIIASTDALFIASELI